LQTGQRVKRYEAKVVSPAKRNPPYEEDYSGFGKYAYSVYWGVGSAKWPMANGYYATRKEAEERAKLERRKSGGQFKYKVVKREHRVNPKHRRRNSYGSAKNPVLHEVIEVKYPASGGTSAKVIARLTYQKAMDKMQRMKKLHPDRSYRIGEMKWSETAKNPGGPLDTHAAKELELFVENDADLYRQQYTPINKNLITKMARGVYNHDKAVKLFGYLMESGAKKYAKQYSSSVSDWHQIFSPATRKSVAELFARHFEAEAKLGNYDNLLPKKYSQWRLKTNPNRMCDVLVRKNGKTFKAKAKYDAQAKRVRIFVPPGVAAKINPRVRKTRDYWAVEGYYYGTWEEVTAEDHRREALQRLKEYRENEPGTAFRLKMKREKIEAA
jgi:hypothetical protein